MVSPLAMVGALVAVGLGARGATRETIAEVLGLRADDFGSAAAALVREQRSWARFEHTRASLRSTLEIADPAFIAPAYREQVAAALQQEVVLRPARDVDLGPSEHLVAVQRTELLLVALWDDAFDPEQTAPRPFVRLDRSVSVTPTMRSEVRVQVDETAELLRVHVPHAPFNAGLVTTFIVPQGETSLADLEARLPSELESWQRSEAPWEERELSLVRFGLRTEGLDACELMAEAPRSPCSRDADLSGIGTPPVGVLRMSRIASDVRLDVTERHLSAAAEVLALMSITVGGPPEPVGIDRAFLFVTHDRTSGVVHFLGRVVDPQPPTMVPVDTESRLDP